MKEKTITRNTYHIFFSNLANPLRISIISSLKEKDKNVSELVEELKVEQSKLSHALRNLRNCNIVNVKIKGKEHVYSLNKKTILPILKLIDKHAQKNCGGKCKFCMHNKEKCGRK
jgi:DNA-binding transcriptional ArsR family regulator